ncbi:Uncharacterized protein HZ326_30264 [Fusarium oxysporum f. sp. albedinis]|nr:Uncharacterized protein HZ326_30264 [Fusarium oxysporum f. sp. albedinis]
MWKCVFFNIVQGSKSIPPIKVKQQADYELEINYEQTHGYLFCAYPNAFTLSSNVELTFNEDTSHLESCLEASATQVNVSIGWGSFCVSSSHKSYRSSSRTKSESTANGMHTSLRSPQIVA